MTLRLRISGPRGEALHSLAPGEEVVLGRGREATITLLDPEASRRHLSLRVTPGGVVVTDLGGANGTFLEGQRLEPHTPREVLAGGRLVVGATTLVVGGPPRVAEEYEHLNELGRGAYGQVYRARHRQSGAEVAIKVLLAEGADPVARARFLREARVGVRAPQVAAVHDVRSEGARLFLIMELVPGPSLRALLEAGPLALPEVLRVGEEVALGLAAAHAQHVVHRDVKPANVLVVPAGPVKLVDFGIATERGSVLTATGTGMGTLDYTAPEQAQDAKRVSASADLYGLGATLYHAIGGRAPFDSREPDFFERLFGADPPPLRRLRPDCPQPLDRLVRRLLEKDASDRPPSAKTVAARLRRLREGG